MASDYIQPTDFRRTLIRAVAVPPALLGALALVFLGQILYLVSTTRWVEHTDQVIGRSNALLKVLVDGETGMRGYLLTNDPVFLEPYHTEETESGPAFEALEQQVSDNPAQAGRLRALRTDHAEWQQFARGVIAARRDGGDHMTPVRNREDKRRMDAMRGQIAGFIRVEEQLLADRIGTARTATWLVGGVSLGLALVFGTGLAALTRRQLLRVSANYGAALVAVEARAASLQKSAYRLETLHGIDRAILMAQSVPELVRGALDRTRTLVPARDALVVAFAPDGEPVQVIARDEPAREGAPTLLAGVDPTEFSSHPGPQRIPDLGAVARSPMQERLFRAGYRSCLKVPLDSEQERFGVLVFADPEVGAFTDDHSEVAEEIGRQLAIALHHDRMRELVLRHAEQLERKVEERTYELQESLGNVRQLQGMLPICAWCKKVRDDQDYWHTVEHYISAHTGARFTHAMCPVCHQAIEKEYGMK